VVSDYWGDADLAKCCKFFVSLLNPRLGRRQRGSALKHDLATGLVDNFLNMCEAENVDAIMVGSGLDDSPREIDRLDALCDVVGNDAARFEEARNPERVKAAAEATDLRTPARSNFASVDNAIAVAREIGYPCVIKPRQSGGGAGIRFVRSEAELRQSLSNVRPTAVYLQQYIRGLDLSCSVLGTGERAFTLSLQGQLIGMPSSGRPCDFVYCGNYAPVDVTEGKARSIAESCEDLCLSLSLKGSSGVDLVLDQKGEIWLMEVNPRLQGSLEMIEHGSGASVTLLHYLSWLGELPTEKPPTVPAVRMIVYANRTGAVGNLSALRNIADVTPEGVLVRRGDPVCTVVMTGKSVSECCTAAIASANQVQAAVTKSEGTSAA
jgi:predicted ATP-grasp superfamily ATP-dependent carboligase